MISSNRLENFNELVREGYFSYWAAILCLIVLPLHVQYLPPFMILWALCWLIEKIKTGFSINYTSSELKLFALFVIYYLWQSLSLLYTTDIKLGFSNLFGRLSLLLFPLLLISPGAIIKKKIKTLSGVFAISTFLFLVACLVIAFIRSSSFIDGNFTFNTHPRDAFWLSYFYNAQLTANQHPTYISMYVLLSAIFSFEFGFDHLQRKPVRVLWVLFGAFLVLSQYFISSRSGILACMIILPVYFGYKINKLKKYKFSWIWILVLFLALIPLLQKNQRVDYIVGKILQNKVDYERKDDPRLTIWKSSFNIIEKNILLGVGIGDVRSELSSEYERMGNESLAKERFNAHNQFIEVLLENGLAGIIIFVSIFAYMFYISYAEKNYMQAIFLILIFIYFMFETMLYRLAGVSFFSLFSFLLLYYRSGFLTIDEEIGNRK